MTRAPIALTCGEPASIAPEITAKAWAELHPDAANCFFLIGDAQDFVARIFQAGLQIPATQIEDPS
ncbi:MAG TPA: 4-hydroxythreonine-4-phosphate dehydrogenase, partial [Aestuariivirga sp.]